MDALLIPAHLARPKQRYRVAFRYKICDDGIVGCVDVDDFHVQLRLVAAAEQGANLQVEF